MPCPAAGTTGTSVTQICMGRSVHDQVSGKELNKVKPVSSLLGTCNRLKKRRKARRIRRQLVSGVVIALQVIKLQEAKKGFVLLPRRWVVERSLGWLNRFRRLARDMNEYLKLLPGFISWSSPCLCSFTRCQYFAVTNTLQGLPLSTSSNEVRC